MENQNISKRNAQNVMHGPKRRVS